MMSVVTKFNYPSIPLKPYIKEFTGVIYISYIRVDN